MFGLWKTVLVAFEERLEGQLALQLHLTSIPMSALDAAEVCSRIREQHVPQFVNESPIAERICELCSF